ncbi:hypothetical protein ACFXAZ_23605 [Streptomyces sp. NPDC059477]|uniref:hypothetical protein n=1 Tax=Streptomyces sp. NPDC059477 TaxID=3346847 RepID=UPI0036AAA90D
MASSAAPTTSPKTWRAYAADVRGRAPHCDHYVPEEAPAGPARLLSDFLAEVS